MLLDKFGRHDNTLLRNSMLRGPPGEGFHLTQSGDYDMKHKIIVNLSDPINDKDGVNLGFIKKHSLTDLESNQFNCNKRIITNVGYSSQPNDSATVQYVNDHTIHKSASGFYDADNKLIRNIQLPILDTDAATRGFVNSVCLTKNSEGIFDVQNSVVRNISPPVLPSDAVNLSFFKTHTPSQNEVNWEFNNKRLSNIKDPLYPKEAVNLRSLQKLTLTLDNNHKYFDALNLPISNVGDAIKETDVINLKRASQGFNNLYKKVDKQMRRFASALFVYLHSQIGIKGLANVNAQNYLNWEDIRNID